MSADISDFPLRSQVRAEAVEHFRAEESALALEIVDLYGEQPSEEHREWMQMLLLRHARGDLDLLLQSVEQARRGYKRFLDKIFGDELGRLLVEHPHMSITLMPLQPPHRPLTRREAVSQLDVSWTEFDNWVEEKRLLPLQRDGQRLFAVADLERLQREREAD